jgi:HEAT repeat protein
VGALVAGPLGCGADGASTPSAPASGDETTAAASPGPARETASAATAEPRAWTLPAEPARTRSGQLRFVDPELTDNPAAARMLLDRLASEPRAEVRAALVEALPRTGGEWLGDVVVHFGTEPAAAVRVAMAAIAPRAPRAEGGALLGLALRDPDPSVRTEAALATPSLAAPAALEAKLPEGLAALLADSEPRPRAAAARSLGILGAPASFAAIRPLLRDAEGEVRLQALHALERLEPNRAARIDELASLERDADARVARLASRLRAGGRP